MNIEKAQQCHIRELNPSFLFDLHQGMVTNEHHYVTEMALSASMGDLWGNFIAIFYIWNKVSKSLYHNVAWIFNLITYNSQHFEPIQYVNGLSRSLPTFQVNDFKVTIDLDDFPSLSNSMMQQPLIQL